MNYGADLNALLRAPLGVNEIQTARRIARWHYRKSARATDGEHFQRGGKDGSSRGACDLGGSAVTVLRGCQVTALV
jgi:hypothetical protein